MSPTEKTFSFEEDSKKKKSETLIKVLIAIVIVAILAIGVLLGFVLGKNGGEKKAEEMTTLPVVESTTEEQTTALDGKYRLGDYIVTEADSLRLRDDHTTNANMLIAVPRGARISVSDVYFDPNASLELQYWGLTSYMGHTGWIALYYTQNAYSESVITAPATTGVDVPTSVVIGESTTYGTQLTVTQFVPGDYIVNADSSLRIRQSPSVDAELVATIPTGVRITITEVYEDTSAQQSLRYWGKVTYDNCTGWIAMFYLVNVQQETSVPTATTPAQ